MSTLKDLFEKLTYSTDYPDYCRYTVRGKYFNKEKENPPAELTSRELLEVGRTYPIREQVVIAYFGEESTRVLYFGENKSKMLQTLQSLKIPKVPSNLGETVFKMFKQYLEKDPATEKPISFEAKVYAGKEHQFITVLKKLVHVYSGLKIDEAFYAAL